MKWERLAAAQGNADAQSSLGLRYEGRMYHTGRNLAQDFVQSYMWYHLAAAKLKAEERESAIKDRDRVAAKMTAAQVTKAQQLARQWQTKHR